VPQTLCDIIRLHSAFSKRLVLFSGRQRGPTKSNSPPEKTTDQFGLARLIRHFSLKVTAIRAEGLSFGPTYSFGKLGALMARSWKEGQILMTTHASGRHKADATPIDEGARLRARARPPMADRRARILQVAARRFAEFGFAATTVRQIADDVNILSGSLFHHFATKEDMLHEIVRDAVLQMQDNVIRISRAPLDAEHRLVTLILLDLGELTRNQEVHAILFNERKLFRHREEFAYVAQAKKKAYLAWKSVLQAGMKAKLFRPNLDIYLTISTILRMLNIAADRYKNEDGSTLDAIGSYTLEQVMDFHLNFILSAVRAPSRTSEPIPRDACIELAKFQG
jgi:AcrR family transcriptional regulator